MTPVQAVQVLRKKIRPVWKAAFAACFLTGLLTHMPILLSDIPNHDGLANIYNSQNMVISGRWFLTVACGISSYYTLPWVIGLLGFFYLGCAAAVICEILEVRKTWVAALCGALLAVFPALVSVFAYVYAMDGYMLALLLAALAVLAVKKHRYGFLPGALCLAFSMGIYQAYLPFAMILSVFAVWMNFAAEETAGEQALSQGMLLKGRICVSLRYLYMGILGGGLYYLIMRIMLILQHEELVDYQGIGDMAAGAAVQGGILRTAAGMYSDFAAFSLKGNILFQNVFSLTACLLLTVLAAAAVFFLFRRAGMWKKPLCLCVMVFLAAVLPALTNVVLLISPSVNYHLLMRYQWVLYAIGAVALAGGHDIKGKAGACLEWGTLLAASMLVFCYFVTDNIAYSNLQKKYEKTYAYCVRLLDRIEQTPGYYPGIPVAMIGVVSDEQFPTTDLTLPVTANMIGINGDSLLYTGINYQEFMKYYLGATLNILPADAMEEMYYLPEYVEMESFPGRDSIRVIDGIMYVKTENTVR